jgi:hypothetical protein
LNSVTLLQVALQLRTLYVCLAAAVAQQHVAKQLPVASAAGCLLHYNPGITPASVRFCHVFHSNAPSASADPAACIGRCWIRRWAAVHVVLLALLLLVVLLLMRNTIITGCRMLMG